MKHAKFVIKEFTNPSGEVVFRASGWSDGKRIRQNFPTYAEAEVEADTLEIKRVQGETGIRPTVTRLTEDELHEAEAVVRQLAGKQHTLSFYVDFALANYREPVCQKSLVEAAAEYVAAKRHEFEQDLISDSYFVRLEREMDRIPSRIPVATVAEITSARLDAYFEFGRASRKTYNNRRGTMSGLLKFALHREWITENPLAKIPAHRIRRRRSGAQTLVAAWPRAYPLEEFPIVPTNLQHLREKAVEKFNLTHDVMRHTSAHVHFDVRREIPVPWRSRAASGQFGKHHPEALARSKNR